MISAPSRDPAWIVLRSGYEALLQFEAGQVRTYESALKYSMRLGRVPVSKIGICECLFPRGAVASCHKPSINRFTDLVLTADTTHMIRAVFVGVRIGPATPARFLQRLFSGHNNLLSRRQPASFHFSV
jgi:hypothetical protein